MRKDSKTTKNFISENEKKKKKKNAKLPTIYITYTLLQETFSLLASFFDDSHSEGIVYWFGMELGNRAVVTTLIVPNAETDWGCISTTPEANADVTRLIVGTPLVLLGQAHSHPKSFVKHSDVDDRQTFASFEGSISVVVPYFGRCGINLKKCGIHRHSEGSFKLIESEKINEHIVIIPGKADLRRKSHQAINKDGKQTK